MAASKTGGGISMAFLLVGSVCAIGCAVPERETAADQRHLLLLVERGRSGFRVDEVHVVDTPLPTTRAPRSLRWRVEITDAEGRTIFSDAISESGIRRGVFANADGTTDAITKRTAASTFPLRVPLLRDAAHIRFLDTTPDVPNGALALEPTEAELGVVAYPTGVR